MAEEKKQAPVKKYRAGGVSASIWKNKGEERDFLNVSFEKSYKDKDGNWQTSTSYNNADLANLCLVTDEARRYIAFESKEQN